MHTCLWLKGHCPWCYCYLPKIGLPYLSQSPKELVIILGEWWKSDVEAVIDEATQSGLPPNISDAHTINGLPGPVSTCLSQEGFNFLVEPGKKYLLRIINAALNEELFFKIAGHNLTVVEVDAAYVKPFETETILTAPGQTTNVILSANLESGKYLMVTSPYMDSPILVNNNTATATLQYIGTNNSSTTFTVPPPRNATSVAKKFMDSLRSLNSKRYPAKVPMKIDHSLFFTISLGLNPCESCYRGFRIVAAINNVTFVMPSVSLLNAHFFNKSGVFTDDFPGNPPYAFDYTGIPPENLRTMEGTRLYRLEYNS
ncbi:Laccase-4 [Datura stramonium]|uniref:laccase n=1 Tax=Datura stramonium TaxID=4076 RepID=A0ABS8UV32_DATST|nr:Laccase-4 [Datura stramonium]